MGISLTIIFFMTLTFILRFAILKKIKVNNSYQNPLNSAHIAIYAIKVVNATCFIFVVICMGIGLFLFEFFYTTQKFNEEIWWYIMITFIALSGLYYGLMLHSQYFFFTIGNDYIKFNFKLGQKSRDAIKIPFKQIKAINQTKSGYSIMLNNNKCYFVSFKKIKCLIGSEMLIEKLKTFPFVTD